MNTAKIVNLVSDEEKSPLKVFKGPPVDPQVAALTSEVTQLSSQVKFMQKVLNSQTQMLTSMENSIRSLTHNKKPADKGPNTPQDQIKIDKWKEIDDDRYENGHGYGGKWKDPPPIVRVRGLPEDTDRYEHKWAPPPPPLPLPEVARSPHRAARMSAAQASAHELRMSAFTSPVREFKPYSPHAGDKRDWNAEFPEFDMDTFKPIR